MLIKNVTDKFDIPHEAGQFMVLRRLTWKQLQKAADVRAEIAVANMRRMGAELLVGLQAPKAEATAQPKPLDGQPPAAVKPAAKPDPLNTYDRGTLLEFGIASWSYDGEFKKDDVDSLDPITADWAARTILKFAGISDDIEAEAKNG